MAIIKRITDFETALDNCEKCIKNLSAALSKDSPLLFENVWNSAAKNRKDLIDTIEFTSLIEKIVRDENDLGSPSSFYFDSLERFKILNVISDGDTANRNIHQLSRDDMLCLLIALEQNNMSYDEHTSKLIFELKCKN